MRAAGRPRLRKECTQGLGHDSYRGKGEERPAAKAMAIDGHGGAGGLDCHQGDALDLE
jgi:hypothetical protein